jgi:hypothetical protein
MASVASRWVRESVPAIFSVRSLLSGEPREAPLRRRSRLSASVGPVWPGVLERRTRRPWRSLPARAPRDFVVPNGIALVSVTGAVVDESGKLVPRAQLVFTGDAAGGTCSTPVFATGHDGRVHPHARGRGGQRRARDSRRELGEQSPCQKKRCLLKRSVVRCRRPGLVRVRDAPGIHHGMRPVRLPQPGRIARQERAASVCRTEAVDAWTAAW